MDTDAKLEKRQPLAPTLIASTPSGKEEVVTLRDKLGQSIFGHGWATNHETGLPTLLHEQMVTTVSGARAISGQRFNEIMPHTTVKSIPMGHLARLFHGALC